MMTLSKAMAASGNFVPRGMQIDQEKAKKLFEIGGKLVVFDVPQGTEFGIDYNAWNIGPKFKGIKFIPPGVHFIYYSAADSYGGLAPRTSFFCFFHEHEVLVRQWDSNVEDVEEIEDDDQVERVKMGIKELDMYLGTYPLETLKIWRGLTGFVTEKVVAKHQPLNRKIASVQPMRSDESMSSESAELVVDETSSLRPTKIPTRAYPAGASPESVTQHSLDQSWLLKKLLEECYHNDYKELLGELQMMFVCFAIGYCEVGFNQWKALLNIITRSGEALVSVPELYNSFMEVLLHQLQQMPEDIFAGMGYHNTFLSAYLKRLSYIVEDHGSDIQLARLFELVKAEAMQRFGDIGGDDEEDQPVVVDLG